MILITRDDWKPALARLKRLAANPYPVTRAMGSTFKSITEGNFNSAAASMRSFPWVPKTDGTPSNLQKSTTLSKSFHLEVTATTATVSNSAIYPALHQFGGDLHPKGRPLAYTTAEGKKVYHAVGEMPARPFFPVLNGQLTPKLIAAAGERAALRQSKK
jgi:phage gpG-like protein